MNYSTWIHMIEALEAGAWYFWITESEIVVIPIPSKTATDDRNRLHDENSPAMIWLDAKLYYWHGVQVTEQIIERPETITVTQIETEPNAERRRVMCERYGWTRYFKDCNAKEVARDRFGVLYRKDVPGDEAIVFIDLENSTPEPDGSHKHYLLRINPRAYKGAASQSPHAAVASTWQNEDGSYLFPDYRDYKPSVES